LVKPFPPPLHPQHSMRRPGLTFNSGSKSHSVLLAQVKMMMMTLVPTVG
jgi:hypothetical protein